MKTKLIRLGTKVRVNGRWAGCEGSIGTVIGRACGDPMIGQNPGLKYNLVKLTSGRARGCMAMPGACLEVIE